MTRQSLKWGDSVDWSSNYGKEILCAAYELKKQAGFTYPDVARALNQKYQTTEFTAEMIRKALSRNPLPETKQESNKAHLYEMAAAQNEYTEIDIDIDEEAELQQAIEEAKEKARAERDRRIINKLLKERGRTELLLETISNAIVAFPLPDPVIPPPIRTVQTEEENVLLFSDAQIGEEIKPDDTNGFGEYNIEIFKHRMQKLTNEVRRINEELKHPNSVLNILMLGDNVDGIGIYRGQEHHLDALVVDQFLIGVHEIGKSIIQLLGSFEKLRIWCIVGNHGRIGRKGENPSWINWDYVLYKTLEMLLANYNDRIEWHIPKSNWTLAEINGHGWLLLHGDTIKAWNSIPYYGIDRADSRLTKMLSAKGKTFRYLVLGHHHNPGDVDSPGGEKILNGTMVGGSDFSINQLHTSSRPSQWYFGVDRKRGITWRHKILLDED